MESFCVCQNLGETDIKDVLNVSWTGNTLQKRNSLTHKHGFYQPNAKPAAKLKYAQTSNHSMNL